LYKHLRISHRINGRWIAARVDCHYNCLCAETPADRLNQRGIGQRGGVDADSVGARFEYLFRVRSRANTPANRERHEEFARRSANGIE